MVEIKGGTAIGVPFIRGGGFSIGAGGFIDFDNMFEKDVFEIKSGRELFNELSNTMLNKRPINELQSHILKGHNIANIDEDLPFTPTELSEYILVDGSFVVFIANDNAEFLQNTQVVNEGLVFQWFNLDNDEPVITRRFMLIMTETDSFWVVTEFEDFGDEKKQKIVEEFVLDFNQLFVFDNKSGVLFDAQKMYRRLEEIEASIADQTKKSNMKTIVTGYSGDLDQAKAEFNKDNRIVFMDGDNVKVIDVANANIVQKLLDQQDKLEPRYLISVHLAVINDVSNVSGISRRYVLTPMVSFVNLVRKQMTEIYDEFGYKLTFSKDIVNEVDERNKEFDLLVKARDSGAITEDEFNEKIKTLII